MIPQIYPVANIGKGQLYVMPKPSAEWLEEDVKYFASLGVTKVVSLLESDEEFELGLRNEKNALQAEGIDFLRFAIKDRNLPEPRSFGHLVDNLYRDIQNGQSIAVHCRAGIGRTGVLACCLLIKDNLAPEQAIDQVSAVRNIRIPDTQEQFDFICDYQ
ncbi:dual specificity protein phosphatase family protein [Pleionea sp. CnH1-48]|uniref:protein-tyrosine phosphatase family protein n=1 Tax=Pleionea sp. CnH1-48 TaxID=2954494 RepID=UPI0020985895|nr:dual specificity protein phosphatase family protein [Pleionea sp. CnH1-48]MCO7223421.1 dual specificity protein phosphatase family protein [Pleionea sp. CnH1-48]